jgi:ankyrin repeat protein
VVLGSATPNNVAYLTNRDIRDIVSHDPVAIMRGLDMRSNATPAHLAAAVCDSPTGIATLKHLAEVTPRMAHCPNNDGDLPLHFCVMYSNNLDAVKLLVELYPGSTKVQGLGGMTPLYCALDCRDKDKFKIVQYLVEFDPESVLICDSNDNNPVHFLAHQSKTLDDMAVLESLLRACPSSASRQNVNGFTPLHFLCKNVDLAKFFPQELAVLVANIVTSQPDSASIATHRSKKLPHHIAAEMSTCEVMNLLLKAHPRGIFECGQECGMPMHCVASSDNVIMFHFLFRRFPQAIAMCDEGGFFPIHYAVLNGSFEMICAVLEKGPEGAGRVTYDGKLPLHLVMEDVEVDEDDDVNGGGGGGGGGEVIKIVQLLLKLYPQAVSMPDNDGLTPYVLCPPTNNNLRRILLRAHPKIDPFLLKELNFRARRWGLLLGFCKNLESKQQKQHQEPQNQQQQHDNIRTRAEITVIERLRRLPKNEEYLSKMLLFKIVQFL